jgi:hypothetical protein
MQVDRESYRGWPNCYRLSNGVVDVLVTADVGPRILRFGFVGAENEFKEYEEMMGLTGGDEWRIYGGHRLWHAPESRPRTYYPDNSPVELEQDAGFIRLIQPTETTTGIQKEIEVRLSSGEARVAVTHRLRNTNAWAVELAPWALSVMAPGGKAVVPLPPRAAHEESLLPTGVIALWAYTDMADHRWTWGKRYVILSQDERCTEPQKAGFMVPDGWAAYARHGHLFVKRFGFVQNGRYPDSGCSVELFTDAEMLELETLAPLTLLQPGSAVEHVEHWFLFRDVPEPRHDADVDRHVIPRVAEAHAQ